MVTESHENKPIHHVAILSGGGIAVLHQLVKLVFNTALTNLHPFDLYSGGMIADSGSTYSIALLQKMSPEDVFKLFIQMAPEAMPGTRFLATQTINNSSRFTPEHIHSTLQKILGNTKLDDLPHGLSIGILGLEEKNKNQLSERIMVVPDLKTGKKYYPQGSSPELELVNIVIAATSIPTINKPVEITGKDGTFCDPTIDQNPLFYGQELRRRNPDANIEMVCIGGFSPSRKKLQDLFGTSPAHKFQSWIKGIARQAYIQSESHQLLETVLGIPVRNFETEIDIDDANHPRFNPIDSSPKQLRLLCEVAIKDIETRRKEYLQHANELVKSYKIRHEMPQTDNLCDSDFDAALSKVIEICETALNQITNTPDTSLRQSPANSNKPQRPEYLSEIFTRQMATTALEIFSAWQKVAQNLLRPPTENSKTLQPIELKKQPHPTTKRLG
ncbi:MAG: patatin-like phospholipase family protein [Alphaproteobacteria bacterium]|nr:patatin-like phospholipase family protein [Alphaproteobacteria bacterium]